jgi:hypothetical protein
MQIGRARLLAERLHADDYEEDGAALLEHIRRVARRDLDLIAHAGPGGRLARLVKIAHLQDRCLHPRVRADGWSSPYRRGLALLTDRGADTAAAAM